MQLSYARVLPQAGLTRWHVVEHGGEEWGNERAQLNEKEDFIDAFYAGVS